MKELFVSKTFRSEAMNIISLANVIIAEYQAQGYKLTLRQLFYQFVARGLLPNSDKSYGKLGETVSDARLAGLIDWSAIDDLTRHIRCLNHWDSPAEIVRACGSQYHRDWWDGMKTYVEVWVEKDALIGIVEQSCEALDTPCFSCRGYVSQTAMYLASKRFINNRSKQCVLLHLGDHDPSGIDMTRDIQDRLNTFEAEVEVKRIALNMDQVRRYNPPPNPAKLKDTRSKSYVNLYGDESWELDALPPEVLDNLIKSNVMEYVDEGIFKANMAAEKIDRETLVDVANDLEERE